MDILKQKMQLLVTEVRKSWKTNLLGLTQNDCEFVARYFPGEEAIATAAAATKNPSAATIMTLEDRLRSFPPRSELGGRIRNWFEEILAEKSQMLLLANRERLKSFHQFRLQLLPLHDEVLQKMTQIFQKYKPIVSEESFSSGAPSPTATALRREIEAFFVQHQAALADISSQWIIPESVAGLLKFLLLTRDELLSWVAEPPGSGSGSNLTDSHLNSTRPPDSGSNLTNSRPPGSNLTSSRPPGFNLSPTQYMKLLETQQQHRDQLYRERQLQINQMKDAAAKQAREKKQLFQEWALSAPFPGWITQLEKLLVQQSDVSTTEWQNTTLRMRKIAAALQQLLTVHAEKQLQGMLRAICQQLLGFHKRHEQQFLQTTRAVLQSIQQLARNLPDAEFQQLREWMSLREQLFEARAANATSLTRALSSVSVWTPAPPQIKSQIAPS